MRFQQWVVVFILSFWSQLTFATMTITTSGASGTGDITGTTGTTFWYSNINAAGTLDAFTGGANCSPTRNPNCKNPTDRITISVTSTVTSSGGKIYLGYNATAPAVGTAIAGLTTIAASQSYTASTAVSFTPTVSDICSNTGAVVDNNCVSAAYPKTVIFYAVADANNSGSIEAGEDFATITMKVKSSITQEFSSATTPTGLYQFVSFPGDKKVHFKNIVAVVTFPNIENGIKNVRFYYTTGPNCDMSTVASVDAFARVGLTSTNLETTVDVTTAALGTYFLKPLENDITYYFKVALRDYAGNIGYLTPVGENSCGHSAKPSEVVGLLSEKMNCFIATAAFGSPMAPQVEILRNFRGAYLMKSKTGRTLVRWYYKNSPAWARAIEKRPNVKAFVRVALTPLVGFSYLSLKFGAANASMFAVTLLLLPFLIYRLKKAGQR